MRKTTILIACTALLTGGCMGGQFKPKAQQTATSVQPVQTAQSPYGQAPYGQMNNPYVAAPQPVAQQPSQFYEQQQLQQEYSNGVTNRALSDITSLQQRIQRLEKAMIRLDRRMQIIERQELGRMSGLEENFNKTPMSSQKFIQHLGNTSPVSNIPPSPTGYPQGMVPMAHSTAGESRIVSSLQPAPRQMAYAHNSANKSRQLPSLADKQNKKQVADSSIAVWTIQYNTDKIWPDRNQLPASREVVDVLKDGKTSAIFARGAKPNSRQFRDRVRALSRYLGKVADANNVAISAMPASHLDENTIEIFATK